MSKTQSRIARSQYREQVVKYLNTCPGLEIRDCSQDDLQIYQKVDGKTLSLIISEIEDVITRMDSEGQTFLQVNFLDQTKILLTSNLVGFKPFQFRDLDMDRLPKVVTTPDLVSVVEAIQESMSAEEPVDEELNVLKKVFSSVLMGGERVGFDLSQEKIWLHRLGTAYTPASA